MHCKKLLCKITITKLLLYWIILRLTIIVVNVHMFVNLQYANKKYFLVSFVTKQIVEVQLQYVVTGTII